MSLVTKILIGILAAAVVVGGLYGFFQFVQSFSRPLKVPQASEQQPIQAASTVPKSAYALHGYVVRLYGNVISLNSDMGPMDITLGSGVKLYSEGDRKSAQQIQSDGQLFKQQLQNEVSGQIIIPPAPFVEVPAALSDFSVGDYVIALCSNVQTNACDIIQLIKMKSAPTGSL